MVAAVGGGTYSFADVFVTIAGPGGNLSLGAGSGVTDEGVTVEPLDDKSTLTMGADGSWMHSLHAAKGGRVTVRLLKTSPVNNRLMNMYNYQQTSAAYWGANTLSIKNPVSGDSLVVQGAAFMGMPSNVNGKEGGMLEWRFAAGQLVELLGTFKQLGVAS